MNLGFYLPTSLRSLKPLFTQLITFQQGQGKQAKPAVAGEATL